ncbi:hypothetical protein [Sphingomonas sp.]
MTSADDTVMLTVSVGEPVRRSGGDWRAAKEAFRDWNSTTMVA